MRTKISLITIIILLIFKSCSKVNEPDINGPPTFILDVCDATNLVVTNNQTKKSISKSEETILTNLYKITFNDELEEVNFINADTSATDTGNVISHIEVESIIRASNDYLIFIGDFYLTEDDRYVVDEEGNIMKYKSLLVRIEDGVIFNFNDDIHTTTFHYKGEKQLPSDSVGNLYYSNGLEVFKLDISNPDYILKEQVSPPGQIVNNFEINNRGDLMYIQGVEGNQLRIRKTEGSIYDLESSLGILTYQYWKGLGGEFYVNKTEFGNTIQYQFLRFLIDSDTVYPNPVIIIDRESSENNQKVGMFFDFFATACHKVITERSVIFLSPFCSHGIEILEKDNKVIGFSFLDGGINPITSLKYTANQLFVASGTHILKIPLDSYEPIELIPPNSYDIYSMELFNDDELIFSGLRFQDGKKVIGKIDFNGTIIIIEEEMNSDAIILERIN